ncbi:uncharacterized protein LOC107365944 [Tetranychus urticae]|uniref:Uncharacterized protein n=1 Tax=Tetranychus urticae TaxID=32264 RepID=T1KP11_TETUR|nr:uncharacterized protein LOC107365944 [Tetranychus urticae]
MSEDNDSTETTIKVKLGDEDYHDIVIDWTDDSCEYKQQLLFRKLAEFTGIPSKHIFNSYIHKEDFPFWLENTDYEYRYDTSPVTNETLMTNFKEGDCFAIRTRMFMNDERDDLFSISVDLISSRHFHPTECRHFWCPHKDTRGLLNKRREMILNSGLQAKIKAALPERRYSFEGDEWVKTLVNFNIRQYYGSCCSRNVTINTKHTRDYLPHRG